MFLLLFLPENTQITIETKKSQQKQDPVLQKVYHWLKTNEDLHKLTQQKQVTPFYQFTTNSSTNCILIMIQKSFILIILTFTIQIQVKKTKYVYHSNYFMQLLINIMHMDTLESKYPLKFSTNFILYHI